MTERTLFFCEPEGDRVLDDILLHEVCSSRASLSENLCYSLSISDSAPVEMHKAHAHLHMHCIVFVQYDLDVFACFRLAD